MTSNKHPDMMDPPVGKSVVGTSTLPLNDLEKDVISSLDEDKVSDLAECLFTLNNRHYGPIAGAYVAVCTIEGKEWCVGQLNADRAKPLILFEDKVFGSPGEAQDEAIRLKEERGESVPCRNH
ncbi:hypothetical protein OAR18_04970 [Candidatus Pseudothioglobus singularis]|jgi:hypothetical protein|nr:hypothetical protein [Candidatus Pseudothioglobus singularis]MDC3315356.1 hypothetical protein [Candidatus Thioglobus sp.]MDC3400281.1 hypothetical protein [bacterium]MDA7438608.1 hypothetical protein [Candidatus Pseudothioglobus singularis]MDA7441111.1 hypothetical protein [Candidatus Pseudothioglobus singularis]MDA9029277.1 hypothetical protein [Candidatus Pseudothioglobus singularis]|tara:strand:+ start:327 stop:695 length:369 start_codon:yes stop_codon:yes gene_type:complete